MKLERIHLRNFKGIQKFELEPNGEDLAVFGDNATGKTSLVDAFMWLLFDKDSANRSVFEIKTIDPSTGEVKHGLEHEVAATLLLEDGSQLELRKVYEEKWTKKRGSSKAEHTGHTTNHFIDGVPVQKKEYDERIREIADEDTFRLLTDPTYFNTVLHWQDRRRILLEVCGDVTDEDVIASSDALARLPEILGSRTMEQHRKIIDARRREINKELERIPVKIGEVEHGKPDTPDRGRKVLEAALETAKSERADLEKERARVTAGGEIAEKKRQLSEIETKLQDAARRVRGGYDKRVDEAQAEARRVRSKLDDTERESRKVDTQIEDTTEQMATLEKRMANLREEWERVDARTFEATHDETCPACGQELPAEQVEAAHEKALSEFNAKKATELTRIQKEGHELKAKRESLERRLPDMREAKAELEKAHATLASDLEKATRDVDRLKNAEPDLQQDKKYAALAEERDQLQAAVATLQEGTAEALEEVDARIEAADGAIADTQADLAKLEQIAKADARIKELSDQERELAKEYEELEQQVFLTEEFTRAKVGLLEKKINSRFDLARFKLFDVQVNGALNETCTTTYDGVPYDSLNHGARLNVGLDIINTLSDFYGFTPPVWIDNAESVTSIIPTRGQAIKLVVSASDKKLRVERTEQFEEVAA